MRRPEGEQTPTELPKQHTNSNPSSPETIHKNNILILNLPQALEEKHTFYHIETGSNRQSTGRGPNGSWMHQLAQQHMTHRNCCSMADINKQLQILPRCFCPLHPKGTVEGGYRTRHLRPFFSKCTIEECKFS